MAVEKNIQKAKHIMKKTPSLSHRPYIIYGRKPVIEALRSGLDITELSVLETAHGNTIQQILKLAESRNITVQFLPIHRMEAIEKGIHHQGVVATLQDSSFTYSDPESILVLAAERQEAPALAILDQITDPHNLGAIIRSAVGAGMHGIIIPKHHSAEVNATVLKTSAGTALFCKMARVTNLVQTMEWLKSRNIWIYGASATAEKNLYDMDFRSGTAVIIGSEGKGMRRLVEEHCDFLMRIPLHGPAESLNASVAAGVIFFEIRRQRLIHKK